MTAAKALLGAAHAPQIRALEAAMKRAGKPTPYKLSYVAWSDDTERQRHGRRLKNFVEGGSALPPDTAARVAEFLRIPVESIMPNGNPESLALPALYEPPAPVRKPRGADDFALVINDGVASLSLNLVGVPIERALRVVAMLTDIGIVPRGAADPPVGKPHD